MDSFEFNKIAGAILAAMLSAMVIGLIGNAVIPAHHDDHAEPVYLVAMPESDEPDGAEEETTESSILAVLANADAAEGEGVTKKCASCHSFDDGGPAKIGPNLWNIVNKPVASSPGFSYSDSLAGLGGEWDYERLDAFLADPKGYAPGTKMSFAGLKKIEDRADLIAWMRTQSPAPVPLPVVEEAPAAEDSTSAADAAVETVTETVEATPETVAETASETAETMAEAASEVAESAAETATEAMAGTTETVAEVAETAEKTIEETVPPATEETPAPTEDEVAAIDPETAVARDMGTMLANADIAAGESNAKKCLACHNIAANMGKKIGPNLWDIVGQPVAAAEGFKYSEGLTAYGGEWSFERLYAYLEDPKGVVPGTKMGFPGIKDTADLVNLIAWLRLQSGDPVPIPN